MVVQVPRDGDDGDAGNGDVERGQENYFLKMKDNCLARDCTERFVPRRSGPFEEGDNPPGHRIKFYLLYCR